MEKENKELMELKEFISESDILKTRASFWDVFFKDGNKMTKWTPFEHFLFLTKKRTQAFLFI